MYKCHLKTGIALPVFQKVLSSDIFFIVSQFSKPQDENSNCYLFHNFIVHIKWCKIWKILGGMPGMQ